MKANVLTLTMRNTTISNKLLLADKHFFFPVDILLGDTNRIQHVMLGKHGIVGKWEVDG